MANENRLISVTAQIIESDMSKLSSIMKVPYVISEPEAEKSLRHFKI